VGSTQFSDDHFRAVGTPETWSYSTLREIESCPRKYVLQRGIFPEISDGAGYPQKLSYPGIRGMVIHIAVERVVKRAITDGVKSSNDPKIVSSLKALGGFSKLLRDSVEDVFLGIKPDFRNDDAYILSLKNRFNRDLVKLVSTTQGIVRNIGTLEHSDSSGQEPSSGQSGVRNRPIIKGTYSEVDLKSEKLRIKGRVDLIIASGDGVQILDFKSGAYDECFSHQILMYGLLWRHDQTKNPQGQGLSGLAFVLSGEMIPVILPNDEEWLDLEKSISEEIIAADEFALEGFNKPILNENCKFCPVRQFCDEYWLSRELNGSSVGYEDLQVEVLKDGKEGLLDIAIGSSKIQGLLKLGASIEMKSGTQLRILGTRVTVSDDGSTSIDPNQFSEIYVWDAGFWHLSDWT
jgi:hypothetical protein